MVRRGSHIVIAETNGCKCQAGLISRAQRRNMRWRKALIKSDRACARLECHTRRNHGNILKQKSSSIRSPHARKPRRRDRLSALLRFRQNLTGPPGARVWRGTALGGYLHQNRRNRKPKHREMQLVFWASMRSKPPSLQLTHRLL